MQTRDVLFLGRVQGVCFRATVSDFANELGICGNIRNLADGSVKAIFFGEPKKIDLLIDKIKKTFLVSSIVQTILKPDLVYQDFEILF